jgi:hypothetical protein
MQLICNIRQNELGGQQQALAALSTEKRPGIDCTGGWECLGAQD